MIKDFPIEIETKIDHGADSDDSDGDDNDFICMRWKDVKVVSRHPPDVGVEAASSYVDAIRGFVQDGTKKKDHFLYMADMRQLNRIIGYHIYIHKEEVVEPLCLILPQPFLQISFKLADPADGADKTTFSKRLELTDMLKECISADARGYLKILRRFPPIEGSMLPLCDVSLGWREQSQPIRLNLTSFVGNLFGRESSKDMVIVAGNGAEIRCHKVILEAHSDVLAAMVSLDNGMEESKSGRIKMVENSEEGISQLVRYLYGMELNKQATTCDIAVELFKTADKYKLEQLVEALLKLLLSKGKSWFTPDDLLELYFHVKNLSEFKSMQEHTIFIMLSLREEIRVCDRFREIERTDAKATTELLWTLLDTMSKHSQCQLPTSTVNAPMKGE